MFGLAKSKSKLIAALPAIGSIFSSGPMMAEKGTPLAPPARFDHPFDGKLIIKRVDRSNVWPECSSDGEFEVRKDAAGCAFRDYPKEGECTVYLAKRTKRAPLEAILRHEIAHCNGWSPDHKD